MLENRPLGVLCTVSIKTQGWTQGESQFDR